MIEITSPEQTIELLDLKVDKLIAEMNRNPIFRGFLQGSIDDVGFYQVALTVVRDNNIHMSPALERKSLHPTEEDKIKLIGAAYKDWMPLVRKYMHHNSGYMATAAKIMGLLDRPEYATQHPLLLDDKKNQMSLIDACRHDVGEEKDHDVYAFEDALHLGLTREQIIGVEANRAVRVYGRILHDSVESTTPLAFLGPAYILTQWAAMSGEGAMEAMYQNLIKRSGIVNIEKAVSAVWQLHVKVDRGHIEEHKNMIRATPLQYGDHQAMVRDADGIAIAYARIPSALPLEGFVEHLKTIR